MAILDSGERRDFGTGAVRDLAAGKGRCDLLPLREVSEVIDCEVIEHIAQYMITGEEVHLFDAIRAFADRENKTLYDLMLELAQHYEEGCEKYGGPSPECGYLSNWQLGIPLHCYIDSGVRHYLKYQAGQRDEPHDRAFVWNLLGCVYTQRNKPEMIDLPFVAIKAKEPEPVPVPPEEHTKDRAMRLYKKFYAHEGVLCKGRRCRRCPLGLSKNNRGVNCDLFVDLFYELALPIMEHEIKLRNYVEGL